MKRVLLFSGQGSQYVGMGKDLSEQFPVANELFELANSILGFSITDIMFHGPDELLKETRYTQPALFVHECAVLHVTGIHSGSAGVAGHSLGEYTALYAAGVVDFEAALRLVKLRAELMFQAGNDIPGTMAAIVGLADEDVINICNELHGINGAVLRPANFNSPGQVVISGSADYVRSSLPIFKERGAKIVKELQVSGAFHSDLLASAKEPLLEAIAQTKFNDANMDVYVNVSGQAMRKSSELRVSIGEQLTQPVQFTKILSNLNADGYNDYVEVGPGRVLQGLVKRSIEGATVSGLDTAQSVSDFLAKSSS